MNTAAWLGVLVALALVAVMAIAWLAQRPLLYVAGGQAPERAPAGIEEITLSTADGLTLAAWWVPAQQPAAGAAIVLPGNAGTRADREPLGRLLVERGFGALLVDYRGYAGNPGRPTEAGLLRDALAAQDWLAQERGVRAEDTVYVGESLGAAVAAALAAERPPAGLLLRSPFPSLAAAAAAAYGLPWVPAVLLRDRYAVAEQVASLDGVPVEVLAGEDDEVVPPQLSREVARAAGARAHVVDGAGHNDPRWLDGPELRASVDRLAARANLRR